MFVIGIMAFKPAVDINTGDVRDLLVSITTSSFHVGIIFVFLIVFFTLSGLSLLMAVGYCTYGCCCKSGIDYKIVSIFGVVKTNSHKKQQQQQIKIKILKVLEYGVLIFELAIVHIFFKYPLKYYEFEWDVLIYKIRLQTGILSINFTESHPLHFFIIKDIWHNSM